jgi:hypothetical protein
MSTHRLARVAAGAFALAGVIGGLLLVRAYGSATDPDPDSAALATSFETPSWPLALALALPLLALAGSVVFSPRRRSR